MVAMVRDGSEYLSDVFNYLDMILPLLNLYLTLFYKRHTVEDDDYVTRRALAAIASSLIWFKAFYWMKLFDFTSFYIRLIVETLKDVLSFLILFLVILMTFGNAILIMDIGRGDEKYTKNYFDSPILNVIFDQYLLSMGEFNGDGGYFEPGADKIVLVFFIIATFLTQITFLNMLIAIMGDTFSRISEVKD